MATIFSTVLSTTATGASKFWAWLKKNPIVLWLLIGLVVGVVATAFWDRRHPVVKTVSVTDTTSVKAVQDKLDLQIQQNKSLTVDLATAQNQIINLQSSKKVTTHVDKKADGEVITDTTFEQEMKQTTNTQTNTTEQQASTEAKNVDESKLHNETDTTHTVTTVTTTPMVAPRLLLTGAGGLQFSNSLQPAWAAGASFHAGTFLWMDLYPGAMYFSPNHTVLVTFTLGVFH